MEQASGPINVADYERLAEEKLDDGTFGYFAGGAGDEHTVRANREAFDRWRLRPRMLVDVSSVSTATTVLGEGLAFPILTSPVAYQRIAHPDGEAAVARATAELGTIQVVSTFSTTSLEEISDAAPEGRRWFQLYWHPDRGITRALLEKAQETGFSAVAFTLDVPVLGRRERDLRTGFALPPGIGIRTYGSLLADLGALTTALAAELIDPRLTWKDLEWLHEHAGMPVLAKGILTAEDAVLAAEHGCAALIVSNHGGRQLDRSVASLDALSEVFEAVGDRVEVLMDGGVRRGVAVAIALCLGARAVMVGRPVVWGLAADGEEGVRHVLELLRAEFELALALLGCASPAQLGRTHVAKAG